MSFDALVSLSISLSQPPIPLASFGVPLVLAVLTGPQATAWTAAHSTNLYAEVTPSTWQTEMTTLGVTTSDDIYRLLEDMFSQEDQPERAYIGRRATAVAMARRFTISGAVDGTYTITINGTAHAHVAASQTQAQIRDALIALIQAGAQAPRVTATNSGATTIDVTADLAGETFTDSVASTGSTITVATQTANAGIATDIPLIRAQVDDWYWILETTRDSGNLRELAATVEPLRKYAWVQTDDAAAQAAGSTDIGSELGALSYVRTAVNWDDDDNDFVDAAWVGLMAPSPPGSASWHAKTLASVTGIVPTGESFLAAKHYNWAERFVAAGFTMTRHGWSINGTYTDIVVGRDWLYNLIQTRCIEAMRAAPKIPYDERGAAILRGVVRGALLEAADAELVDRDSIVVNVPTAASQSSANRAARNFPGITFSARLTGAVHSIAITGALAP